MNPVVIYFFVFSFIYVAPVLYVQLFGFAHGGVMQAVSITPEKLGLMAQFYGVSAFAFLVGVGLVEILYRASRKPHGSAKSNRHIPAPYRVAGWQIALFWVCTIGVVGTKILLIPEGVYSSYAFDSGGMDSKMWNVSMGFSEMLLMFLAYFLAVSNRKFAVVAFCVISLNLLHGTRMFTFIALFMIFCERVFLAKVIRMWKATLLGAGGGILAILVFLVVFLHRSGATLQLTGVDFDMIISPLVYESLFNQISFVRMLDYHAAGTVNFAPQLMLMDIFVFRLPGFLTTGYDFQLYSFGSLSPLGGLSGYASALIYFGDFYFIFYFVAGMGLQFFYTLAMISRYSFFRAIFLYLLCSTFFRSFRDPWIFPGKMLFDNLLLLLFLIGLSQFLRPLTFQWRMKRRLAVLTNLSSKA